jgi:uncharacterized membrane protein
MTDLDALERIPLFEGIPADLLASLREGTVVRSYAEGERVFNHGDVPKYLYIVQSGQVDILLPALGEAITLATFDPGSFFGELSMFDHQPRSADAEAVLDSIVLCVPLDGVAHLLETHPPAARHFMRVLIGRLRNSDELLARVQIRNVNEMADEKMSVGERVADLVARFGGSWTFIICFFVFLVIWMAVNAAWLLTSPPDPYPYIFLNLILSCLAALQAPVIMMSQNRQASKDRLQADEDFRVNVKAEFAIQQLHRKMDELRASLVRSRS